MRVGRAIIWTCVCIGTLGVLPFARGVWFEEISPECTLTFITAVQEGVGARQYAQSSSSLLPRRTGETRTGAPVHEEPRAWEPDNAAADVLLTSFAGAGEPMDLGSNRGRGVPMGEMEWPLQPFTFPVTCSTPFSQHAAVPIPGGSLTAFLIAIAAAEQSASETRLVLQYEDIERLLLKFIKKEKTANGQHVTGCIFRSALKRLASRVRRENGKLATEADALELPFVAEVLSLFNYNETMLGPHLADAFTHEDAYQMAPVIVSLGMAAYFGVAAIGLDDPSPLGMYVLEDPEGPANVTAVGIMGSISGCEHAVPLVKQKLGPEKSVLLINMPAFRWQVNKALSVIVPDLDLDPALTRDIADKIVTAHVWGLIERVAPTAPRFALSFSTGFRSILGPRSDEKTGETVVAFEWVKGAVIHEPLDWALGLAPDRVKAMLQTERPVHDLFVDISFVATVCQSDQSPLDTVHKAARKVEAMLFKGLSRASSINNAKLRLRKLLPEALRQLSTAAASAFGDVDAKYSVALNGRPFSLHTEQSTEPVSFVQEERRKRKSPGSIDFTLPMDPRETRYTPINVTGLRHAPTGPISVFPPDDVIAQVVLPSKVGFKITLRPVVGVAVSISHEGCGCVHGEFHCNGTVLCCDPGAGNEKVKCCDGEACVDMHLACGSQQNDTEDGQCKHGEFHCNGTVLCCDPDADDGKTLECDQGGVVVDMPINCCGTKFVCNGTEMCCDPSAPASDVLTCCDGSMGCRKQPRNCSCQETISCGNKQICCVPDTAAVRHDCGPDPTDNHHARSVEIQCRQALDQGYTSKCNGTHFANGTRCSTPKAPKPRPRPDVPKPGPPDPSDPDPPRPSVPTSPSDLPGPFAQITAHAPRSILPKSPPLAVHALPKCKAISVLARYTGPDPNRAIARLAVTQIGADTQVWELTCGHDDGTCSAVFYEPAAMPYTQRWAAFVTDADSRYQFPSVSSMGGDVGDLAVVLDIAIKAIPDGERSVSMIADVFRLFFRRATRDPRITGRKIFYSVSRESMQAAQAEAGLEGDPTRPPTLEKANELARILARPDHISSRFLRKLAVLHIKYGLAEGIVEAVVWNVVSAYLFGRVPGASADAQADSAHVAFWVQAGYVRPEAVLRVHQTLLSTGCENAFVATRQSLESPAGNPSTQVIALHAQAAHGEREMWAMVVNAAWGVHIPAPIRGQLADMASRLVARQEALALPEMFQGIPTVHVEVSDAIRD